MCECLTAYVITTTTTTNTTTTIINTKNNYFGSTVNTALGSTQCKLSLSKVKAIEHLNQ